jgi:diguanylate cyclase (GGDEF)-like protein
MRITKKSMQVFVKNSSKDQPFEVGAGQPLGFGLYCETVIGENRPLKVPDAREDRVWADNPDVDEGMVSYYGVPIRWSDGEMFGTICVLDREKRTFPKEHERLLELFRDTIETDLENLELFAEQKRLSNEDMLTGIANRRHVFRKLEARLSDATEHPFTLVVLDIDDFKAINDTQGHMVGDDILKTFASLAEKHVSDDGFIGRLGGDEFLMVLDLGGLHEVEAFMETFSVKVGEEPLLKRYAVTFSFGVAVANKTELSIRSLFETADRRMFRQKDNKKKR